MRLREANEAERMKLECSTAQQVSKARDGVRMKLGRLTAQVKTPHDDEEKVRRRRKAPHAPHDDEGTPREDTGAGRNAETTKAPSSQAVRKTDDSLMKCQPSRPRQGSKRACQSRNSPKNHTPTDEDGRVPPMIQEGKMKAQPTE